MKTAGVFIVLGYVGLIALWGWIGVAAALVHIAVLLATVKK